MSSSLALIALYGVYELVRGFGGENWAAARAHTGDIVALEQHLSVFVERDVQSAASAIAGVPALLGFLYVALHFAGTAAAAIWIHRRHPAAFAHLRTTLIVATAIALVGYVFYPAAPPRLADLGFADTVTSHTGLNLSSDFLGSLYNPIAAVPSLHFGYALAVGVALVPRLDAPQPPDRVRALSRADAARDRRDRQPLLLRRSSRRPRGRGRLVGRLAARSLPARRRWGCPHPQTPGLRIHPARSPEQPRTRSTHPRERKQCHP